MDGDKKARFMKVYSDIPINIRKEIIAIIEGEPISWNVAFLEINNDVEAVIVSDQQGLVIAGEKRKDIDMEIVSVLTTLINPVLERIRNEFSFKKF